MQDRALASKHDPVNTSEPVRTLCYTTQRATQTAWQIIPMGGNKPMRLERFTEKAQEAFQEAQEIMHEQHHTQLDVEHIFLAMLRQREGLTGRALERLGVDVEMVVQRVERELE